MQWLQSLDANLFRFINQGLSHPVLDRVMPFFSGNEFFNPFLFLAAVFLIWKDRLRGLICLLFMLVIVGGGDSWICNLIKSAVERPRPFLTLPDAHVLVGRGRSWSMPSSHAANWFAGTMILLVSFSRVYNGVHYPSDVLIGGLLGAGYAAAGVLCAAGLWQWAGRKWFPLWWQAMPSLIDPEARALKEAE